MNKFDTTQLQNELAWADARAKKAWEYVWDYASWTYDDEAGFDQDAVALRNGTLVYIVERAMYRSAEKARAFFRLRAAIGH